MTKIVACYCRVSTAEQAAEGYSLGEQTERLKKYCEAHDWNIYKIYTDPGFSGSNTNRPALQQMIADAEAGKFQKVLVYKLDRLSRSQKDTLYLIEDKFLANNVDFISMNENFDTSTPFGRAMIGILAVFAQLEREQIKERVGMGRLARAKEGKFSGGCNSPFGYIYKNGELVIDDYEAMIVREAFDLVAEGYTVHSVVRLFNEKGYRSRTTIFRDSSLKRILMNKTYIGLISFSGKYYEGSHDPIIDVDTFAKVQELLEKRAISFRSNINSKPGKATSYLGGMIICAHCGAHYYRDIRTRKRGNKKYIYHFYSCASRYPRGNLKLIKDPSCKNKTWKEEDLDNIIFNEIKKLSLDPDYINEIASVPEKEDNSKIIQDEIGKLDAQITRLMDLYQIGSMPIGTIIKRIKEIEGRKSNLEQELLRIRDERATKITAQDAAEVSKRFPEILESGNLEEGRRIIRMLIDHIEIDGDDIMIHWNF